MKQSRKLLSIVALMGTVGFSASAAPVQWTSASGGNDHWYEMFYDFQTWDNAKADAEARTHMGLTGYLATVTSQTEQNFLNANVNTRRLLNDAWLGGSDAAVESDWEWVTGETWDFTNWQVGEPNNAGRDGEDYLAGWFGFGTDDRWNDWSGRAALKYYVVEYGDTAPIPLPATGLLLIAGLGGIGAIRRKKKS